MSFETGSPSVSPSPTASSCKAQVFHGATVSCSVCLEVVADGGERSIAKLKCGHYFHLDCIGSAFNAKGKMQCPNCRQVEQGQWLYANSWFLHEDFVDDFSFEDDAEVYGGAATVQFGHTPWCPHQGAYTHFPISFVEDLDNFANVYMEPLASLGQGSRVSAAAGHICPFLAAQGMSAGGLSDQVEDLLSIHVSPRSNRNTRRAANNLTHGSHMQRHGLAASSSSMSMSQEGSMQSFNQGGRFVQASAGRHSSPGLFMASHQSVHTGSNQGQGFAGQGGNLYTQLPRMHNAQGSFGNPHLQSSNALRNQYVGGRQVRHNEALSSPVQRPAPSSEGAWMNERNNEFGSWVASTNLGQSPNQITGESGMGWTPGGQIDPWSGGFYTPASYVNSSHWWAWVPPSTTQGQRALPNALPNAFSAALFPRPPISSPAVPEHPSEGTYTWLFPGPR